MNNDKKWYQSKTIYIALIQLAGGILAAYLTKNPTWVYGASAKSALDIGIRLVTDSPVS